MHLVGANAGPTGSLVGCIVLQELYGWAGKFTFFTPVVLTCSIQMVYR